MVERKAPVDRGARAVVREIDRELQRVDRGLAGYEGLLRERERLLAARATLMSDELPARGRRRVSQDEIAAFLVEHPGSRPGDIAAALGVPLTNVSAHLYRGKASRFVRGEDGWRVRSGGGVDR